MENYAYYIDKYCDNRPLVGYGTQFKQYLDEALSGNTINIISINDIQIILNLALLFIVFFNFSISSSI